MKLKDATMNNLHPIFAQALAPFVDPDFFSNVQSPKGQPAAELPQQPITESISNEIRPV